MRQWRRMYPSRALLYVSGSVSQKLVSLVCRRRTSSITWKTSRSSCREAIFLVSLRRSLSPHTISRRGAHISNKERSERGGHALENSVPERPQPAVEGVQRRPRVRGRRDRPQVQPLHPRGTLLAEGLFAAGQGEVHARFRQVEMLVNAVGEVSVHQLLQRG